MAITDKNTIYSWFQTDDFPTEAQFRATWDSFWHKSESIPASQITGLNELFNQTASISQLNQKANKDGSNINVGAFRLSLGIKDKTTTDVASTTTAGAINPGDIIPAGTTIQELTELLFNKTFYPTYSNHSFSLINNAGLREVGSSFNITLTFNFNRGQILGKLVGGIWKENEKQADRLGTATSYLLNGSSSANNSASFNVTTILGTNILSGSVAYGIGAQPKDSKGNNFESPFPAGTSPVQNTSFEGIYPYFYYKSKFPITPEIMQSSIANGQATKVLGDSTGTITIPFAANGDYIAVAYPEISTTKTIWYVNALDNGKIEEGGGVLGDVNMLLCDSPTNLWNDVPFKIHVSPGLITQDNPIQLKN